MDDLLTYLAQDSGFRARVERLRLVQEPGAACGGPADAVRIFAPLLRGYDHERMAVAALTLSGRLIAAEVLTVGTHGFTIVDAPQILRWVLTRSQPAASFLLAHNHPSGEIEPSRLDRAVTDRIYAAAKIVGVPLVDHLILTDEHYTSFVDRGFLVQACGEEVYATPGIAFTPVRRHVGHLDGAGYRASGPHLSSG